MSMIIQQATHIGWDELADLFDRLLSNEFNKEIDTEVVREDYYDWHVCLSEGSLTNDEQEQLFLLTDADDMDREANCVYGDYPIVEIAQGLARKIISLSLPFAAGTSHADDHGVWFIASEGECQ
ncbi:MAG: hypothetical protein PHY23_00380 [Oscillospiraceae bacterium]|nr:hypothetical protein [Oscillospiraceae bacterium]